MDIDIHILRNVTAQDGEEDGLEDVSNLNFV
jgi:hypothetical protein